MSGEKEFFSSGKKLMEFSQVLYAHLDRLSALSISLFSGVEKIAEYEVGIEHLKVLLMPYLTAESGYKKLDDANEIERKKLAPFLESEIIQHQVKYITCLQKKLSGLITVMYDNNLLDTKKDSYISEMQEDD